MSFFGAKMKFANKIFILTVLLAFTSCVTRNKLSKTPEEKKAELFYSHGTSKLLQQNYREALKYLKMMLKKPFFIFITIFILFN